MNVLLVTGIFPPAIGGPATHAADVAAELGARGHRVTVLTLSDVDGEGTADARSTGTVVRFPRRWSWPRRSLRMVAWMVAHRRAYDVVYATGVGPVAVAGARLARRPVVLKLVTDPAWERAVREGLSTASFSTFQLAEASMGVRVRAMRWLRSWSARHATRVVTPSPQLSRAARDWRGRDDVVTIPNGVRAGPCTRASSSNGSLRLVFVGRLVAVKRVELVIAAVAAVDGVTLDIVGEGPARAALLDEVARLEIASRVTFCGPLEHARTLEKISDADALVLASAHEGLPHAALEALASGTPLLAVRSDGVTNVVEHGVNGLVVDDSGDVVRDLAAAVRELATRPDLLASLADGAADAGTRWRIEPCVDQLEQVLRSVVEVRPRAVSVGKSRAAVPPTETDERKFAISQQHLDTVVVCTAARPGVTHPSGARVIGLPAPAVPGLGSACFYLLGPPLAVGLAARHRPAVVVAQSPFEGACVLAWRRIVPRRRRPRVQIELHGDWHIATRLYGSPLRRIWSRPADALAESAVRRADRVRAVSHVLEERARAVGYEGAIDRFVAYSEYGELLTDPPAPMPATPRVLYAGVMERSKGVDVLLDAWPSVIDRVPGARLLMVGTGTLDRFVRAEVGRRGLSGSVEVRGVVPKREVGALLDDSTCLVLPSRSEGLPRVVLEAMARGRAVVATRVGGVAEWVDSGTNGWLVEPDSAVALADALCVVLERDVAEKLGGAARAVAERRDPAGEYAAGVARLAQWIGAP